MFRRISVSAVIGLVSFAGVGCQPSTYSPNATDTQLSAYAGQAAYPSQLRIEEAPHIFASITPDNTITIWNAGDMPLNSFELWVNKQFVLHVSKQDGHSKGSYSPNTLFNRTGTSLAASGAAPIGTIQVRTMQPDQLFDVQGPVADR